MLRLFSVSSLLTLIAATAFAGPTKVRSGQVDFSGGINEDLRVAGDLAVIGTVSAGVLSVTGAATIGNRMEVGDSANDLTITVSASTFNAWIGQATEPAWKLDGTNCSASPIRDSDFETGVLALSLSPGTRLYQAEVHGVFADTDTNNELRARIYKQNIATPTNPSALTAESSETGGTAGPFSLTLTPDYVVEEGYVVVVWVEMKNPNDKKTLFFGVELTLRETTY
jgi:hypothetical protein